MRLYVFSLLWILIGFMQSWILPAYAATACPPWIKPENPRVTKDYAGNSLDFVYWTNPRGVWFRIPYGYFYSWPYTRHEIVAGKDPDNPIPEGFEALPNQMKIAFWLPSLRYPERSMNAITSFQPCEDGRPKPTDEQFIVEATIHWPWLDNPPKQYEPSFVQNNRLNRLAGKMKLTPREFGLLEVKHLNPKAPFFFLHNLKDTSPEFALKCDEARRKFPNPLCDGRVWWPDEKLGAYVRFSQRNIKDWKAIMDGVHTLAHRWRNQAIEELEVWEMNGGQ